MKQQLELSHETTVSVTSAWSFVKQLRPLSLPLKQLQRIFSKVMYIPLDLCAGNQESVTDTEQRRTKKKQQIIRSVEVNGCK